MQGFQLEFSTCEVLIKFYCCCVVRIVILQLTFVDIDLFLSASFSLERPALLILSFLFWILILMFLFCLPVSG